MVNIEIPKLTAASPASHYGTPHLTINRDATADLDSTNAFEGPEKLLEVWFCPSADDLPASCSPNGLKSVRPETWTEMLDLVHCKVLSIVESEHVDAYLLSESSMFVFPHKVVLKTCGTTTLLYGLPRLLEIAALSAGFPHVEADLNAARPAAAAPYRLFYSRKNFLYPNQQRGPHRSWADEVRYLDRLFVGGSAYLIGKMNGEHWYLYITGPHTELTPPVSPVDLDDSKLTTTKFLSVPNESSLNGIGAESEEDETLEILMTDLDEKNARQFYLEDASAVAEGRYLKQARQARKVAVNSLGTIEDAGHFNAAVTDDDAFDVFGQTSDHSDLSTSDDEVTLPDKYSSEGHTLGTVVSELCGLSDVYPQSKYPDARVDAYLFNPCGFSANGVIPAPPDEARAGSKSAHYFTVHVTPEPQCSFASFETNVPARQSGRETADIIEQAVKIFRPGRFSVTLFEQKDPEDASSAVKKSKRMDNIEGYKRVERIVQDLDGYELVFKYFERFDWKGGAPRLGEIEF